MILLKNITRLIFSFSLALYAVSCSKRSSLKDVPPLLPALSQPPIQQVIEADPFDFFYRGTTYRVEPVAEYELWGLVVSHNDINAFSDIYHTEDSVDFRDICVIWGRNAQSTAYKEVTFWSEPWSCWSKWGSGQAIGFELQDLSNNHLLTNSEKVRATVEQMRIGDQIRLSGLLVNYQEVGQNFTRKTSLNRSDDGNGACEIVFVEEAEILKKGPQFWHRAFYGSKWSMILSGLCWLFLFLNEAYRPMRVHGFRKTSIDTK